MIGLYSVINSASIRLSSTARLVYALIIAFVVAALLQQAWKSRGHVRLSAPFGLALWSAVVLFEALRLPFVPYAHTSTSLSDVLVAVAPLLIFWLLRAQQPGERELVRGLGTLAFAASIGSTIAWQQAGGARFEAVPIIAIVGFWAFAAIQAPAGSLLSSNAKVVRIGAWLGVFALLPIIYASRERTSLALWFVCGFLLVGVAAIKRLGRLGVVLLVAILGVGGWLAIGPQLTAGLFNAQSSTAHTLRLQDFFAGKLDQSSQARLFEAQDAIDTTRDEGGNLEKLIGFGPGASYAPVRSYIKENVDPVTGRVHNIHITPVMVWFRYGWIGVIGFAALMVGTIAAAVRTVRRRSDLLTSLLLAMSLGYVVDLLVRNSTVDPGFSLMVALVFMMGERSTKEIA